MVSPAVITSQAAQQHLNDIKVQHGDVLNAMQTQRDRVAAFQEKKSIEQQNTMVMAQDMQKEKMAADSDAAKLKAQTDKDMLQHTQKMTELSIKRDALAAV